MKISEIFDKYGEKYFREVEKKLIDEVLQKENQIISLGGGSLENDFNFNLAKKTSYLVYLNADVSILFKRIKDNKDRPLLKCENPKEKLKSLLIVREQNYNRADYVVLVDNIRGIGALPVPISKTIESFLIFLE